MDDKKKIMIVGGLFVVMLGVGAFQFSKSGDSAPAAPAEKTSEHRADAAIQNGEPTKATSVGTADSGTDNPGKQGEADGTAAGSVDPALVVAAKLSPRDPFDGRKWDHSNDLPAKTPAPVPQRPQATRPPQGIGGSGFKPMGVPGIDGVLPEAGGVMPAGGAKLPSIDDFPYTVSGTVVGERPLVVLTDQTGKQKIVAVGGQIDGDSEVVSVSNGKVTVRHRGKTKSMPVGGINPSNKKQEDNQ